MKIKKLDAYEILDSRGNATVQVELETESGVSVKAAVPSGASTGSKEALEMRDGNDRFGGKGVLNACENIKNKIFPAIIDIDIENQKEIDAKMLEIDGTNNKSNLGANAILGVSLAVCRAAAQEAKIPLWRYIRKIYSLEELPERLPVPMMNIINGGGHSDSGLDVQEYMMVPSGIESFFERMRAGSEIYQTLKKTLQDEGFRIAIGDEGGFAPRFSSNEEALQFLAKAIEKAGYKLGVDVYTGLDVAASEFYNKETNSYDLKLDKKSLNSHSLGALYEKWIEKYHLELIEDPMSEFDWSGWSNFTSKVENKIAIIGDDLIVTNKKIIEKAGQEKACNAALIKLNQIGSLTETIYAIQKAREFNMKIAVSHRSGETTDDFIADLAVAVASEYIKSGAPARGERLCKYNRIIEIERSLNK